MDPNVTYQDIEHYLQCKQWDDASECARHLWNWLAAGGFAPIGEPFDTAGIPSVIEDELAAGLLPLLSGINAEIRKAHARRAQA
jgi:hypothetical protein